jgi:hypothetical protein
MHLIGVVASEVLRFNRGRLSLRALILQLGDNPAMTRAPREFGAYPLRRPRGTDQQEPRSYGRLCECGAWQWAEHGAIPDCTHASKPTKIVELEAAPLGRSERPGKRRRRSQAP